MSIRKKLEDLEASILSDAATLSKDTKGRFQEEEECDLRPAFQRDRDRILHSKSFRRLKHKTQVFIAPNEDHYRTRLTHTLEVSQIARSISKYLFLNEDLTEAIALGHDLGHTPFGHAGEEVLDKLNSKGFKHNYQSVRVLKHLEARDNKYGLNLTIEVLDGIENHSGDLLPQTNEGKVVKLADRIAYINHDIDDAIRAGVIKEEDLPKDLVDTIGHSHSQRIDRLIRDIIETSQGKAEIRMSDPMYEAMMELRSWMFTNVYNSPQVLEEIPKAKNVIKSLYEYYMEDLARIPEDNRKVYAGTDVDQEDIVTDYIASMTDRYAMHIWKEIFEPKGWL